MRKAVIDDRPRSEWERLITEWVHNEVDRQILIRKLLDGKTFDELADELSYSVWWIKERFYRAEKQLFKHI